MGNAASELDLDNAKAAQEIAIAKVAMSEADLAQHQLEFDFTTVRSPLKGKISERYVDIGALVGPGNNSLWPLWCKVIQCWSILK
ncbi:RND family efflux transporter [Carboxylicivirga marina]|uniref:Uncharacterized protein n=1 Tax=Carboxylicivirga marina TaxID=2800988 RepID=A0ABS1HPN2_9BACT|nr:hypothetical protein [Carboxylicivirga marina]MBK3519642.1 hypothetical protein [Carboxylicivirga marina]